MQDQICYSPKMRKYPWHFLGVVNQLWILHESIYNFIVSNHKRQVFWADMIDPALIKPAIVCLKGVKACVSSH